MILGTAFVGFIWAVAMGFSSLRNRNDDGETTREKLFDIIIAILCFVVAGIELFAFTVGMMQSLGLAKLLRILAPVGVVVAFGSNLINVIEHFAFKSDLINQCIKNTSDDLVFDSTGGLGNITSTQAEQICDSAWRHDTWSVFAWLFVTLLFSVIFASIALSYYRQLLDPSSVRQRGNNQAQSFAMAPPHQSFYAGPPQNDNTQQQNWMVPPYPGPPANAPVQGYEKSDYQPGAEWAQYAPPDGPPPSQAHRAEEEAWERARAEGSTAHFTNGNSRRAQDGGDVGFVVPNREEDEAWERARQEGVTAHLTGQGRKGDAAV